MQQRHGGFALVGAWRWLVLMFATGCVLTPNDEQMVCGSDAVVRFSGFTLVANQTVELTTSTSASGPFHVFASALSSSQAFHYGQVDLFSWSVETTVPNWAVVRGAGREAYVRAQLAGGANYLVTFDTQNPRGENPLECLMGSVGKGMNAIDAAQACKSADSPVLRLRAPLRSSCCVAQRVGDVVIDSPTALTANQCLVTLDGNLTVTDRAPASVNLPYLERVHGKVNVDLTTSTGAARNVLVPRLPNIDGSLFIHGSVATGPVELGFDAVDWTHGDLSIEIHNTGSAVLDVNGLREFDSLPSQFTVSLTSEGAFDSRDLLPGLVSAETVHIESVGLDATRGLPLSVPNLRLAISLFVGFARGTAPAPNAWGSQLYQLLPELETASYFELVNDPYYPSFNVPLGAKHRNYPKLAHVGALNLEGTQLAALDLGASTLHVSALDLRENSALTTLTRPGLVIPFSSSLTFVDNPALRQCEAAAFAATHAGPHVIQGNHPAPCGPCAPMHVAGDLMIETPADAVSYACVASVGGSLVVENHPRLEQVALDLLTSVGESVELHYTVGNPARQGDKRVITLPALVSIGKDLTMEGDFTALAPPGLAVGMNALIRVGGSIELYATSGTLSGLAGLTSHAGDIYVHGPNLDVNGTQLMPNLTEVGGSLRVEGFFAFTSFFGNVETVGEDVEIIDVRNQGGFAKVHRVNGDVVLKPKFMSPLARLAHVGGTLRLENSTLSSLDVAGVPTQVANLRVAGNANLSTLDADVRVVGPGSLVIQDNPALPTCRAQAYVASQTAFTGSALVSGNGSGTCP